MPRQRCKIYNVTHMRSWREHKLDCLKSKLGPWLRMGFNPEQQRTTRSLPNQGDGSFFFNFLTSSSRSSTFGRPATLDVVVCRNWESTFGCRRSKNRKKIKRLPSFGRHLVKVTARGERPFATTCQRDVSLCSNNARPIDEHSLTRCGGSGQHG